MLTTEIAPEEDIIFLAKTDRTQRAFCSVVVRFDQTVITVVTQRIPLIEHISERLTQPGFFRQCRAFLH